MKVVCMCILVGLFTIACSSDRGYPSKDDSKGVEQLEPKSLKAAATKADHKNPSIVLEYIYMIGQIDVVDGTVGTDEAYEGDTICYAYTEGRGDAMYSDPIVEADGEDWKWIGSPWESGRHPVFRYLSEYREEMWGE